MVSPQAEVIFEGEQGEVDHIFEDDVPYDLDAPVIEIPQRRLWYLVCGYDGKSRPISMEKVIEITAKVLKPSGLFRQKCFFRGGWR